MRSMPTPYQKAEYRLEVISHRSSHGAVAMLGPKPMNAERVLYSLHCIETTEVYCQEGIRYQPDP